MMEAPPSYSSSGETSSADNVKLKILVISYTLNQLAY